MSHIMTKDAKYNAPYPTFILDFSRFDLTD